LPLKTIFALPSMRPSLSCPLPHQLIARVRRLVVQLERGLPGLDGRAAGRGRGRAEGVRAVRVLHQDEDVGDLVTEREVDVTVAVEVEQHRAGCAVLYAAASGG